MCPRGDTEARASRRVARGHVRRFAWAFAAVAVLAGLRALLGLADPGVPASDLPTFASAAVAILFAFGAIALRHEERWWHWWFPASWIGCGAAVTFLAYKDTFVLELAHFGAGTLAWHMFLHVLIGPIELFFAFVVGFSDPRGPLYVIASFVFALLGAELLRRRLSPTFRGASAGSSADP